MKLDLQLQTRSFAAANLECSYIFFSIFKHLYLAFCTRVYKELSNRKLQSLVVFLS
jgi:hypothetical protein